MRFFCFYIIFVFFSLFGVAEETSSGVEMSKEERQESDFGSHEVDSQLGLSEGETVSKRIDCSKGVVFDARFSYFLPLASKLSNKIDQGGINYSVAVFFPVMKALNLWSALDYFDKKAEIEDISYATRITIMPVTLGLKYVAPYSMQVARNVYCRFYLGAGARYYFVTVKNEILSYSHTMHRNGFGWIVEMGSLFCITEHLVADIFTSFSKKNMSGASHLPSHSCCEDIEVGGWNFGGGLGIKF